MVANSIGQLFEHVDLFCSWLIGILLGKIYISSHKPENSFIMKKILLLSLTVLLLLPVFAQRGPKVPGLKVGLGLPYVFGEAEEIASVTGHHKITGYPTLAVEKPIPIEVNRRNRICINPGAAYHLFHEDIKQYGVRPATGGTNLSNPDKNVLKIS